MSTTDGVSGPLQGAFPQDFHYRFGPFQLHPRSRVLTKEETPVVITAKALELLLALVERQGKTVTKDELRLAVWGNLAVEESNIMQAVWAVRKALGDQRGEHRYILTVTGTGYRFIAPVTEHGAETATFAQTARRERASNPVLHKRLVPVLSVTAVAIAALTASLALTHHQSKAAGARVPSISVIPFATGSLDGINEYLARGFSDEIADHLARAGTVRVISTGPPVSVRTASLQGSIERSGAEWKINTRLIAPETSRVLWSVVFVTDNAGLSKVEENITEHVARTLGVPAPKRQVHNAEAFELYLEGRRTVRLRTLPDLQQGIELFRRAMGKDPQFALAYAALADAYAVEGANGLASPEVLRNGDAAAAKALALDPKMAEAHTSLGLLKYARWDWTGAEREYATALRLNPNSATALMRSAMVSYVMGKFAEAELRLEQAQLLDPSNGAIAGMLCELYYYWRRYGDCIREADQILQFDPANTPFAWSRKTAALVEAGRFPEARIAAQKYAEASTPDDPAAQVLTAWVETKANRTKFELRYQQILKAHGNQYFSPYKMACTYASAGDTENAFRELEIAYKQRITDLVSLKWDPVFDSIRGDPRYGNLLARMGLSGKG